jgi:non-heme chloroperoxidase
MMVEADFRDDLRQINLPTLLIHGDRDRSAPIAVTGIPSAQLIPGSRFLVYKGAPHGLLYTPMDQLHADMLQFVRAE